MKKLQVAVSVELGNRVTAALEAVVVERSRAAAGVEDAGLKALIAKQVKRAQGRLDEWTEAWDEAVRQAAADEEA